jgi:hypothetical protein
LSSLALPSLARLALPRWLPLVVVFILAVFLRQVLVANTDVSWGLVMAEKLLDGQRLYVDIIEVNPPATPYLYVGPALLARLAGLPAEFVVDGLVFLAAGLSLWLAGRILLKAGLVADGDAWLLATVVAVALTILPAQTFGEREHIGLITFLPLLAACAARAKGDAPSWSMVIAAGIGAGITVVIKPHFAAAILCTAAAAALCARSWRPLLALENWIAAALLAAYCAWVLLAFPQFVSDVLPLVMAVYVPAKAKFLKFIIHFATPLWVTALLLIALLKRRAALDPPFSLLLAASFGFSISFFGQQKGWSYHSYPMLALALIALVLAFIDRWHRAPSEPAERPKRLAIAIMTALIAGTTFCWMNFAVDCSALAPAIRALKSHPKMLALSSDLAIGHPLTRQVGGIWVSRVSALWITAGVWLRRRNETLDPQTDARLEVYAARDRAMLAEDIARHQPDVILVDLMKTIDWLAWARSDPALAEQMRSYRDYQKLDDVLILRRADGR